MASVDFKNNALLDYHKNIVEIKERSNSIRAQLRRRDYDFSAKKKVDPKAQKVANEKLDQELSTVLAAMKDGDAGDLFLDTKADSTDPSYFKLITAQINPESESVKSLNFVLDSIEEQIDTVTKFPRSNKYCVLFDRSDLEKSKSYSALLFNLARIRVKSGDDTSDVHVKLRNKARDLIEAAEQAVVKKRDNHKFKADERNAILSLSLGASGNLKNLGDSLTELGALDDYDPYKGGKSQLAKGIQTIYGNTGFAELLATSFQATVDYVTTKEINPTDFESSSDYDDLVDNLRAYNEKIFDSFERAKETKISRYSKSTSPNSQKIVEGIEKRASWYRDVFVSEGDEDLDRKKAAIFNIARDFASSAINQEKISRKREEKASLLQGIKEGKRRGPQIITIPKWTLQDRDKLELTKRLYEKNSALVEEVREKVKNTDASKIDAVDSYFQNERMSLLSKRMEEEAPDALSVNVIDPSSASHLVPKALLESIMNKVKNGEGLDQQSDHLLKDAFATFIAGHEDRFAFRFGSSAITSIEWDQLKIDANAAGASTEDKEKFEDIKTSANRLAYQAELTKLIERLSRTGDTRLRAEIPNGVTVNRASANNSDLQQYLPFLEEKARFSDNIDIPRYKLQSEVDELVGRATDTLSTGDWAKLKDHGNTITINFPKVKEWIERDITPSNPDDAKLKQRVENYIREEISSKKEKEAIDKFAKTLTTSISIYDNLVGEYGSAGRGTMADPIAAWNSMRAKLSLSKTDAEYVKLFGDKNKRGLLDEAISREPCFTAKISKDILNDDSNLRSLVQNVSSSAKLKLKDAEAEFKNEELINSTAREKVDNILKTTKGVILDRVKSVLLDAFNNPNSPLADVIPSLARELGADKADAIGTKLRNQINEIERNLNSNYPAETVALISDTSNQALVKADNIRSSIPEDDSNRRRDAIESLEAIISDIRTNSKATGSLPSEKDIRDTFASVVDTKKEEPFETSQRHLQELKGMFTILRKIYQNDKARDYVENSLSIQNNSLVSKFKSAIRVSFKGKDSDEQISKVNELLKKIEKDSNVEKREKLDEAILDIGDDGIMFSGDDESPLAKGIMKHLKSVLKGFETMFRGMCTDPEHDAKKFKAAYTQAEEATSGAKIDADNIFTSLMIKKFKDLENALMTGVSNATKQSGASAESSTEEASEEA